MSRCRQALGSVALWAVLAALASVPWWCGRAVSTFRKLPPSNPRYTDGDLYRTIRQLESQGGSSVHDSIDD